MSAPLARRDRAVDLLYQRAGKPFAFPAEYVRLQRQWLSRRNRCKTVDCLRRAYDVRIAALAGIAPADERFQHSNYLASLDFTPLDEDWQIFWLGMAQKPGKGQPHVISLAGLVRLSDGIGRWASDDGCVLEFQKTGAAWRVRQSAACKTAAVGQCFAGTYYTSADWLDPRRADESASCEEDGSS